MLGNLTAFGDILRTHYGTLYENLGNLCELLGTLGALKGLLREYLGTLGGVQGNLLSNFLKTVEIDLSKNFVSRKFFLPESLILVQSVFPE